MAKAKGVEVEDVAQSGSYENLLPYISLLIIDDK